MVNNKHNLETCNRAIVNRVMLPERSRAYDLLPLCRQAPNSYVKKNLLCRPNQFPFYYAFFLFFFSITTLHNFFQRARNNKRQ